MYERGGRWEPQVSVRHPRVSISVPDRDKEVEVECGHDGRRSK